jgi:hypothetical protein
MKRVLEELCPPIIFYLEEKRALAKAKDLGTDKGAPDKRLELHRLLTDEQLELRLKQEFDRGRSIDEKTMKFTTALSGGLTVLGTISTVLLSSLNEACPLKTTVILAACLATLFALMGGGLALGALKTLPTYGYGTAYLASANRRDVRERALATQEQVNMARHMRNETAYECLRNAVLLLIALIILVVISTLIAHTEPKPLYCVWATSLTVFFP